MFKSEETVALGQIAVTSPLRINNTMPMQRRNRPRSRSRSPRRNRDYPRRRGDHSPRGSPRTAPSHRGINDRWKHDKFEEEEEDRRARGIDNEHWSQHGRHYRSRMPDDRSDDNDMYDDAPRRRGLSPGRRKKYQKPTTIIYIKGLPTDVTEAEVYGMVESLDDTFNLQAIRLGRDRLTGASRGFGFIEFPSTEDSRKFMESPASADLRIREHLLWINYSSAPTPGHRFGQDGIHMDWMCNMCSAINFARRLECYQCCAPRGKDVQRISNEPMGPSNILKISCLDPQTSENDIHAWFSSLVQIKEVRMVMDKFTNAPRGFAFVHFFSVADASRVMNMFQGYMTETQRTPIKLFYAKDRVPPSATGTVAAAAIEAAQAMQQYNASWEPKEFDESAAEMTEQQSQEVKQEQPANAGQELGTGFLYDANSGYYYHEATGYYYDATTGMYYNGLTKEWLMYDQSKNEYVPYATQPNTDSVSTAQQAAIESTNAAVEAVKAIASKPVKRTAAVIGAKPQLNPQNVAENIKAEQEQKLLKEARKKAREEKIQRAIGAEKLLGPGSRAAVRGKALVKAAAAAKAKSTTVGTEEAPRVKGVIRGGKWSGGLTQGTSEN